MKKLNKDGRTLLTGSGPIAVKICKAFGLDPENNGITRINFDLESGEIATLKVWYEPREQDINRDELSTIFKEYELVERVKEDE